MTGAPAAQSFDLNQEPGKISVRTERAESMGESSGDLSRQRFHGGHIHDLEVVDLACRKPVVDARHRMTEVALFSTLSTSHAPK